MIKEWFSWSSASVLSSIMVSSAFYAFGRFDADTAIGYAIFLSVICLLPTTFLLVLRIILHVFFTKE